MNCPNCCSETAAMVDVASSDAFDSDEVCVNCLRKHGQNEARNEPKSTAEDRREWRGSRDHIRNGSGWPL